MHPIQLKNYKNDWLYPKGESHLEKKKNEKSLITFLLLINDLKYSKNPLFCCNGYSLAILTIFFYESQVEELRKAFTKHKKNS